VQSAGLSVLLVLQTVPPERAELAIDDARNSFRPPSRRLMPKASSNRRSRDSVISPTQRAKAKDKRVLIYNYAFDIKILNYCCRLYTLLIFKFTKRSDCLMEWVAQWAGNKRYYHKDYRYVPLNGNHRVLGDCTAAFELIKLMVGDSDQINRCVPIPEKKL
jgi:hypothetical protein